MDPILSTIIFGTLWFFLGSFASVVVYVIFAALAIAKENMGLLVIGWLTAVLLQIGIVIITIFHAVRLIQLIVG